jgi:hypothetical protein
MLERSTAAQSYTAVRERNILKNVYLWMTGGLGLTGVVALYISSNMNIVRTLVSNPGLYFGLIIGELALVIFLSMRLHKMSPAAATIGFAGYSVLNGITLSLIFLAYTGESIALTFFIAAGTFGGMSLYALTTKRDLSGIGHYLFMALIGLIIASVVNLFIRSGPLYWLISLAGVAIFIGLTAYDTQIIKRWSEEYSDTVDETNYIRISIRGALKLYLDFINMFLFLLRIFGRSR